MENEHILEIRNVTKSFGKFQALKNVSFSVRRGRIVGLLGKNGAGKTTLIKTILGLLKRFEGEILYDGKRINTNDPEVMNTIGSLVETSFHEDLSAYDNLKLLRMATPGVNSGDDKTVITELLELVDLQKSAKAKVKSFSFGMKQRLALAQALMVYPKLLILDEPFVGLDPLGIELVKNKLLSYCRDKKVSIVFSSHQLTEVAEISDDIVILNDGEVGYNGSYEQLVNDTKQYRFHLKAEAEAADFADTKISVGESLDELVINHSDHCLDDVVRILSQKGYGLESIEVEENALLRLFDR